MLNDWFVDFSMDLSWKSFCLLPRHPAYRYEYQQDRCRITGRPVYYHARLDLGKSRAICTADDSIAIEDCTQLTVVDWAKLTLLFASAFSRTVPFSQLIKEDRPTAAKQTLERTRTGLDGPWVKAASHIIRSEESGKPVGASLVTLLPSDDLVDFDSNLWHVTAPTDAVESRWGVPHLTWIFIDPQHTRQGLAAHLLQHSAASLKQLGYSTLLSTFLLGNDASLLWHWKMGFQLLSHVTSR